MKYTANYSGHDDDISSGNVSTVSALGGRHLLLAGPSAHRLRLCRVSICRDSPVGEGQPVADRDVILVDRHWSGCNARDEATDHLSCRDLFADRCHRRQFWHFRWRRPVGRVSSGLLRFFRPLLCPKSQQKFLHEKTLVRSVGLLSLFLRL